jgi:hypothetical protein
MGSLVLFGNISVFYFNGHVFDFLFELVSDVFVIEGLLDFDL